LEQSGLTGEQRRRNVAHCFESRGDCLGQRIALIDDVVTTGSTASAAAQVLMSAGAVRCEVWAVALARPGRA
jgi:predicted amidophosphoribosyltransferase